MISVLHKARPADVKLYPFPHLVIANALPPDLYARLDKEYPSLEDMLDERGILNNARYQIGAKEGLQGNHLSSTWREFVAYHTSKDFLHDMTTIFDDAITDAYPQIRINSVGIRGIDSQKDILLDCQPGMNSPVTHVSSVRGPHTDSPNKLFGGLLYMRTPDDNSTGGDLELYRVSDPAIIFHGKNMTEEKYVETVATVPYANNTLILFLNTRYSIHGVSPRSVTEHPRRLVNFIGEVSHPLFSLPTARPQRWRDRIRNMLAPA